MSTGDVKMIEAFALTLISVGNVMFENGIDAETAFEEYKDRHQQYLSDNGVIPELSRHVLGLNWKAFAQSVF